jgi:hypothetical protein
MRAHGTEAPGSCALLQENRPSRFSCVGCGQPLLESRLKFESGTGWPSFNDPIEGAVETSTDHTHGNRHDKSRVRRMAECLRRSEDDHRTARSSHTPLRHRRDRQRELALQEPRLIPSRFTATCTGGPTGTPARRCVSLWTGTPQRAGPPMDYRHKSLRGVNFGGRSRVNTQRRLTPTAISSTTVAMTATNSSISRGPSCPSVFEIGHIGSDQRALVISRCPRSDRVALPLSPPKPQFNRSRPPTRKSV